MTFSDSGMVTTVFESFDYDMEDAVNITKVTHADGLYWDYAYDNRHRLTSAVRKLSSGTATAPDFQALRPSEIAALRCW